MHQSMCENLRNMLHLVVYFRIISAYENKIRYAPGSSFLYEHLEKRYNDTSWTSFVNMILDMAAEKGCSISSDCHIDVHIR